MWLKVIIKKNECFKACKFKSLILSKLDFVIFEIASKNQ